MARKGGNPELAKFRFTSETGRKAAEKSHESFRRRFSAFAAVRPIVDEAAPDSMLPPPVIDFWKKHGVEKSKITPLMAELTPIYANAIRDGDIQVLERVYKLLGLSFESNREHNINLSVGNLEDKPFEINYIVNGDGQESPGDG